MHLIRRLARTPSTEHTTAIMLGELVYRVRERGSPHLAERVQELIASAGPILPFDEHAARRYGQLRAELERARQKVAEPDLRNAAIALARDATLVTDVPSCRCAGTVASMQGAVRYLGLAVFVALAVLIAVVFDSPTSVLLLVGLSLAAFGLSYGMSRSSR